MLMTSWLRLLAKRLSFLRHFGRRVPKRRQRPAGLRAMSKLEILEDRVLLSALTVNSAADNTIAGDGLVTLREAILAANSAGVTTDLGETSSAVADDLDQIVFGDGSGVGGTNFLDGTPDTILLSLGQMAITSDLTITGQGAASTLIDGNAASRIFDISGTDVDVTLDGLTLQNGRTTGGANVGEGGAIRSRADAASELVIRNSTVTGNSNQSVQGGAVYSSHGDVDIRRSTFVGNSAGFWGGAINAYRGDLNVDSSTFSGNSASHGGALSASQGRLAVTNSTFSGNSASSDGGAIIAGFGPDIVITNSTITLNNAASRGGGIYILGPANPADLTLLNSIVAGNTAALSSDIHRSNQIPNSGLTAFHSLIGNNSSTGLGGTDHVNGIADANGNFVGDGAFGLIDISTVLNTTLADNGGPTMTHAVLAGGLAHNSGNNALAETLGDDGLPGTNDPNEVALITDQRGVGFTRLFNAAVDIGAYELRELIVDTATDEDDGDYSAGDLSLREAVRLANENVGFADIITFGDGSAFGGTNFLDGAPDTILLSLGQMAITDSVVITGASAASTIIDGNAASRIFDISGVDVDVTLDSLTLRNGNSGGAVGGAVQSSADAASLLTIQNSTLSGNSGLRGGAIYATNSDVSVTNSTLSGNSSSGKGGAINVLQGNVEVRGSTLSGNSTAAVNANGGAIFAGDGAVTITDSTLSGNRADYGYGGAIYGDVFRTSITVINSTITQNYGGYAVGGVTGRNLTIVNSIVAGNTGFYYYPDIVFFGSLTVSHSLIGDNSGTGRAATDHANGVADANGNFIGGGAFGAIDVSTVLNTTLALNGAPAGSPLTHALLPGSLALNSGDNALALDADGNPLTTDQRGPGFARISGAAVDMGAFEAQALTLVVDTNVDEDDGDYSAGDLSLREAIRLANGSVGADTITFGDGSAFGGTNFLDGAPDAILLSLGQMAITDSVTITGASAASTIIDGNAASRIFNISEISGVDVNVTLDGLTLRNGLVNTYDQGGAIKSSSDGTLTISNSILSGNHTTRSSTNGGAIYSNSGDVIVSDSVFENNSAGSRGGAIATGNLATVTATNTTFRNNSVVDRGGGAIYTSFGDVRLEDSLLAENHATGGEGGAVFSFGGDITVERSTLSLNTATQDGGAIFANNGDVTVTDSTLSGNSAGNEGGAIYADDGLVTVIGSTLSGNSAGSLGGAIYSFDGLLVTVTSSTLSGNSAGQHGGAIYSNRGAVTVTSSTLSGNSAGVDGGAIYADDGDVTVISSTLSGNSAGQDGGAIFAYNGGVSVTDSTLSQNSATGNGGAIRKEEEGAVSIINSTLSGNSSDLNGGAIYAGGSDITLINSTIVNNSAQNLYGGVATFSFGSLSIYNSIVALNTTATEDSDLSMTSIVLRNSFIGSNFGTGLTETGLAMPDLDGNYIGGDRTDGTAIDPLLGALQDNGGPTFTHALLTGSLALNSGDNALALDADNNPLTTDQRGPGFDRISGGTVDMGAYEEQSTLTELDFGDLPDTFGTTIASDGARHGATGPTLGATRDAETDGQPTADATGDGADEDGITADGPLIVGQTTNIHINVQGGDGFVNAWADLNRNGTFEPEEQFLNNFAVTAGDNVIPFAVPANFTPGDVAVRFRLTSAAVTNPSPNGLLPDGEVEDYLNTIFAADFGDLPDTYGTTLANNGAQHLAIGPTLGATRDSEADGQPTVGATGDGSDEDGVRLLSPLVVGGITRIEITASAAGFVNAWADLNFNNQFDPGEQFLNNFAVQAGTNVVGFRLPAGFLPTSQLPKDVAVRYRLTSASVAAPSPVGLLPDGEVEDYVGTIYDPTFVLFNNTLTSTGTTLNDVYVLDLAARTLTINGQVHSIPLTVTNFTFDAGGGNDSLSIVGATGAEQVRLLPAIALLDRSSVGLTGSGSGFEYIVYHGQGNGDQVTFIDSAGDDTFSASVPDMNPGPGVETFSLLGAGYRNSADGVATVTVNAARGGNDQALLNDTAGDDRFFGRPGVSTLLATTFAVNLFSFDEITVQSSGGMDTAKLDDATANVPDTLTATPTSSSLVGSGYKLTVNNFHNIVAKSNGGGDMASFFGSASTETTGDVFRANPLEAAMSGQTFEFQAQGFATVVARAYGGNDLALLTGSTGDDTFSATPLMAQLTTGGVLLQAIGFATMDATAVDGGSDRAFLADSSGNDRFVGYGTIGILSDDVPRGAANTYAERARGFDSIRIDGRNGGTNRRLVDSSIAYLLSQIGMWT